MKIDITQKEGSGVDRHVQVSVPAESVKEAEDKAARRYASSVRLPGFRPGKAPATMVKKKFAEAIRQEALGGNRERSVQGSDRERRPQGRLPNRTSTT